MAIHGETVFRQRVCLGGECQAVFRICRHCDRGQRYRSRARGTAARLKQRRRANSRYRRSKGRRLDHCGRRKKYRRRQARARVTDQSSQSIVSPARYQCGTQQSPWMAAQVGLAANLVWPPMLLRLGHGCSLTVRCAAPSVAGQDKCAFKFLRRWAGPFPRIPQSG